ncbi:DUF2794 domain-containing protein [Pelagibius litoralis]|uniref:DUF2794 domain-containing protein n=1 Tax=Pelagibius litoralis TaxID=374515 RepID=A0A967EZN0_9PROT|nr:DUF2794 domain-containing protein [Pelagibius litoralis]NIA70324.1 DUF2794 domain-containing protein [Pelagibius litoralis]
MSQLYRFSEHRKTPRRVFFSRTELNQLLSVYSRHVASGDWRDYAIDQVGGAAIFSVFRHTHDAPLFSIAKQGSARNPEFVVFSGREKLKRTKILGDALKVFKGKLKVVS